MPPAPKLKAVEEGEQETLHHERSTAGRGAHRPDAGGHWGYLDIAGPTQPTLGKISNEEVEVLGTFRQSGGYWSS